MTATTDPYMQLLGLETRLLQPGKAVVAASVKPEHLNIHGSCHGGFLYSLADAAFALASNSHGSPAVALSTQMQYFKAVQTGEYLEAHASEENLGRRTATYCIEIHSGERVVALFIGTVFRMEASGQGVR
jgi:acyl-CoA thioesterase